MDAELTPMPMVLMYHSVARYAEDPFRITVCPERFERHMSWLRARGLRGVSMADLLRAKRRRGLIGLTFDDGYADFVEEVMPVLVAYGFTATVFVVAGALGGHNGWDVPGPRKALMTAADVRRAAVAGFEIGSHGLTHRALPDCDEAGLATEVHRSRTVLAELTDNPVTGFCYPYGAVGEREKAAVRGAGYTYACAVHRSGLACGFAIPRTYVGDRDGPARLFAKRARHAVASRVVV